MRITRSGMSESVVLTLTAFLCLAVSATAAEDRIRRAVETNDYVRLQKSVSPKVRGANDSGPLDSSTRIKGIRMVLAQTDAQRNDLEKFTEAQRDPASPDYQNWLTPEQYGERFGMSDNDLANISSWLESHGFVIEQVARARNWITFSGTAGQIARAFRTELHHVEVDGEAHFANTSEAWIPASLTGIVEEIRGLDDIRPKPHRARSLLRPDFNSSNGTHYLSPGDLAIIYDIQSLYSAGFDGAGQSMVIAGQTDMNLTDLRAFRATFSLPAKDPQMVLFGADPGANEDDQVEASLDLEWSGAVARNATIIYVYSRNVFESIQYAIDQNLAPVISLSYGGCESGAPTSFRTLAQQANAEGITWMNSSGDSGAAGCDPDMPIAKQGPAASFPASIPEVTAVGGTEFSDAGGPWWAPQSGSNLTSALAYIPEKSWNDTALGSGLSAGGGAPSLVFPKPWWQTGPGVPNDQARDVPDLSLAASGAHDGYLIYFRGQLMSVGGTSASSPSFAGIVSILNQYLTAKGLISKPGLGNINPSLYKLAQGTTGIFHDITTGNNIVPCAAGSRGCIGGLFGFTAGPGYDFPTGLGSVDAFNLVTKWTTLPPASATTMTLTATPPSIPATASVQLAAAVTSVSGASSPSGNVIFNAANGTLGAATLTGSGSTLAATLTVKGSNLASGVNTITADFGSHTTATTSVSVTAPASVTPVATSTVVTANPASIGQSASTVLTASVRPATGTNAPTGAVTFTAGGASLGAANLTAGTAVLTVRGSQLAASANTILAGYNATGNFSDSSGSTVVTVTSALAATSTVLTATSTGLIATVSAHSGSGVPTGAVTFTDGTKPLGTATLSNSTATLMFSAGSLTAGVNSVVAVYAGSSSFAGSASMPVTVTIASPPVATSLLISATPATLAQSASTTLVAGVRAASGSAVPTGSVSFALGNTTLGSAVVSASGAAVLTIRGSSLAAGANNITASYLPAGNFTGSSSAISLIVTGGPAATTITVSASPGASASTIIITVIVKSAAGGAAAPAGRVTFALRSTLLGSAVLAATGAGGVGTLTLNNNVLAPGNNSITVNYQGAAGFSSSTASVAVTR